MAENATWGCPRCERVLELERLHRIERHDAGFGRAPMVDVTFWCECSGNVTARYNFRTGPMKALFGEKLPPLPWENRLRPSLSPEEIEREVAYARFELDSTHSADEFLWWVDAYSTFKESDASSSDSDS